MAIINIKSAKGKEAGWVDTNDKTYYSPRTSEHYMRMYQGFGIDEEILNELINLNVENICIIYKGKKNMYHYTCKLSQFLKSDKCYNNVEYKFINPQKFVSVKDMKEEIK
jgi:hypothetical protein